MNVLFVLQDVGQIYGQERATLDLVRGLRATSVRPVMLLMSETRRSGGHPGALASALDELGISHEAVPVGSRFSRSLVQAIRERLLSRRADVLHSAGYKADLHAGLAARWGRICPVVSTVHGYLGRPDAKERFYGWLNRRALSRFGRVIVLSRYYESFLARAGIPAARLVRIPSGLDLAVMPAIAQPEGPFTVGLLGRLSWEKNHGLFLRAAEQTAGAGSTTRFLIAGDGPDRPAVEAEVQRRDLAGRVSLVGYLPREEFFSRVHVLALTSHLENLPYTVMEAMAWHRPVVATRVGGLPDLVEDGRTGFLVPADDPGALSAAFDRLAADPALRAQLAAEGRRKLEREFTIERMVEAHLELYHSLRPSSPGPGAGDINPRPAASSPGIGPSSLPPRYPAR